MEIPVNFGRNFFKKRDKKIFVGSTTTPPNVPIEYQNII